MDPWQDYLALPIAPMVLGVQIGAFFIRRRRWRWAVELVCPAAILAMLLYVSSLPEEPGEGVNIGEGVLFLWMVVSAVLLLIAIVVEAIRFGIRQARAPRFDKSP